ncbi:MAG: cytochrome c biogenesis protein CcsA [Xanthomonadales bacterium]|nr:cytochrome c biogenesis protein CcsA [Xanthomonadales bacterium]
MHDWLLALTAIAYISATAVLYRSADRTESAGRRIAMWLAVAGAAAHTAHQFALWIVATPPSVSILDVFSLCALVVIALLLISPLLRQPLFDAAFIALPLGALAVIGQAQIDAPASVLSGGTTGINVHIVSSVLAFGVFSAAGVFALFTAVIDHFLRRHHLNRVVQALPPLEVLERLLFPLIIAGFALLSVSLGSGWLYVDDLFGQHLAHKTILSMLAWVVFAVLIWGRWRRGWRGRIAVRMTLAGMALLLLSYFGSKLVLEILLQRSWQS